MYCLRIWLCLFVMVEWMQNINASEKWHVYGNMVEENIMYQQLQKICSGKFVAYKFFGQIC